MTRALLLSVLLTALLGVGAARADEAPPPPAPAIPDRLPSVEEIAARLASSDAKEREQGEVLLVRALRAAPDRAALLERLAAALRAPSAPARPSPEPAPPAPTPVAPNPTPPAPPGPASPDSPAPQAAEQQQEAEGPTVAPAIPAAPAKAAAKATWTLRAWGMSIPLRGAITGGPEVTKDDDASPVGGKRLEFGGSLFTGSLERVATWVEAAKRVADAEPLGEAELALAPGEAQEAHLGKALLYRCCVVREKDTSWAVETRTIPAGLSLRGRLEGTNLRLEPSWVAIAQPMPTEQARPAPGVDPIELDRPDWSVSRVRLDVGALEGPGSAHFLIVPGLLPDAGRRLVLVLELRPKP